MGTHVMIDLETWGKGNDAVIISLGAVKFDPNCPTYTNRVQPNRIQDRFYVAINPNQSAYKRVMDADTLLWWIKPEQDEARRAWIDDAKVDLATALEGFATWFGTDNLPTWGNGATFDNVILSSAFAAIGMERPWGHSDERCFRTIKNFPEAKLISTPRVGITHNALDDAMWQAYHLQNIATELEVPVG